MTGPVPTPPPGPGPRETFQAFARAESRDLLMKVMEEQAVSFFGGPVVLAKCSAQLCQQNRPAGSVIYQGSSTWLSRRGVRS